MNLVLLVVNLGGLYFILELKNIENWRVIRDVRY